MQLYLVFEHYLDFDFFEFFNVFEIFIFVEVLIGFRCLPLGFWVLPSTFSKLIFYLSTPFMRKGRDEEKKLEKLKKKIRTTIVATNVVAS